MRYRGFEITSTPDYAITRQSGETGVNETCKGYYCQIYDANDTCYVNMFDEFCLAEGHEISDSSYSALLAGIAKYVDGCYDTLMSAKWDMQSSRTYELLGRAMCWAGENESGSELYNTFSEFFGMTDEEIRDMGFTSLVPYFDRDRYAETIANYLIDEGTRDTVSGNLHIPFSEINERFSISLPSDVELLEKINDNLMNSEIVSDLNTDEDFDLMFFTVFCPNHEERFAEESEDAPSFTM